MLHRCTDTARLIVGSLAGFAAFVLVALLTGPLPGDVAATRAIQALVPADSAWTARLTGAARLPWLMASTAMSAAACFWLAGRRGLLVLAMGLLLAFALDAGLRASFHVPKPTPDLVAVASPSPSSGLPSTFALRVGALLGAPLLLACRRRRWPAVWLIATLFAVGLVARVAPGGHWPSQMLATWALLLPLLAWTVRWLRPDDPVART